ncbi:AAA family ATPase [Saccharothrix deserti]|uniref:AAA family ATPase n=1 Tax=Saccharothrix deserti TaxID=2593674 RepID=UPI00131CB262|nr:AAA family ATPase [Saccharothrix deserti]
MTSADNESPTRRLRLRTAHEVDITRTRFVWNGYLPVGEVSLLVGKPGLGKSTVVVDLAAKVTTGQLDGDLDGEPQRVLYSITEDSESMFKARFIAAGGDLDRLHLVDVVYGDSTDGTPLIVNLDLDGVREALETWKPALFVMDALNSSLSGQLNDNSVVRPQLERLRSLAQYTGTAVLCVGHFRKSTAGVDPVDAIGGAGAYSQVVRHALACAAEDETVRVLSVIKSNVVSLTDVRSLEYRTESVTVSADDGGEADVGRIVWLGESTTSVVDLLHPRSADDGLNRVAGPEEVLVRKLVHSGKREIA